MKHVSSALRLNQLRKLLHSKQLQAYIVPSEDEHFNEYVDAADRRCTFLSSFTGSVCTTIVTLEKAALWTDGRYHLQATRELDENWILMKKGLPEVPDETSWLVLNTDPGARIGFDPKQIPYLRAEELRRKLAEAEFSRPAAGDTAQPDSSLNNPSTVARRQLVDVSGSNLVDIVWEEMSHIPAEFAEKPSRPMNPLISVAASFSGTTWQDKIRSVREHMGDKRVSLMTVSALDEIAWLFNLRGSDIQYNPVFFSYLLITLNEVHLFLQTDSSSKSQDALKPLINDAEIPVSIHNYDTFYDKLDTHLSNIPASNARVWFDHSANFALVSRVPEANRLITIPLIAEMKSIKSMSELAGIRQTHVVDSLVLCDFLAWLEQVAEMNAGHTLAEEAMRGDVCDPAGFSAVPAPTRLTEVSVAKYLDRLRSLAPDFVSLSFTTISGADANGSIMHYHPVEGQDAVLTQSSFYLVDSGGQYRTGTTDVTRSVQLGHAVTEEKRACYTMVLKAHIALANQIFPSNSPGSRLDLLCRRELWNFSSDFAHGTGHGVGAFLCVHEGPMGLSGSRASSSVTMGFAEPGIREHMVLTIEPGYYVDNRFGIRLENVNFVVGAPDPPANPIPINTASQTKWLAFEPVTLAPFQRQLINQDMLNPKDIVWLNNYHAIVREVLSKAMKREVNGSTAVGSAFNPTHLSPSRQRCWSWLHRETEPFLST